MDPEDPLSKVVLDSDTKLAVTMSDSEISLLFSQTLVMIVEQCLRNFPRSVRLNLLLSYIYQYRIGNI